MCMSVDACRFRDCFAAMHIIPMFYGNSEAGRKVINLSNEDELSDVNSPSRVQLIASVPTAFFPEELEAMGVNELCGLPGTGRRLCTYNDSSCGAVVKADVRVCPFFLISARIDQIFGIRTACPIYILCIGIVVRELPDLTVEIWTGVK